MGAHDGSKRYSVFSTPAGAPQEFAALLTAASNYALELGLDAVRRLDEPGPEAA